MSEKYEFKSPSYSLRAPRRSVDEFRSPSRKYEFKDGVWQSKSASLPSNKATILIAGDLLCQENLINSFATADGSFDFSPAFMWLKPLLKSADLVIGNLETPIDEEAPYRGEIITHEGPFFCNAPIEYLDALRDAGFDLLTTANNHTLDAGVHGLFATINNVRDMGFIQTGTFLDSEEDKSLIVDVNGFRIGISAFASSYNNMDWNLKKNARIGLLNTYSAGKSKRIARQLKDSGVDVTLCLPHWGKEYSAELSAKQEKMAEEFVQSGWDVIVGAHSHVLQPYYDNQSGSAVAYSLGNALTHLNLAGERLDSQYTALYELSIARNDDGSVSRSGRFIPCRILKDVEGIPYAVLPVDSRIDYPESISKRLSSTCKEVSRLLNVPSELLDTQASIVDELVPSKEVICAASSKIRGIEAAKSTAADALDDVTALDTARLFGQGEYRVHEGCVLRIDGDAAAAVRFVGNQTVARVPKAIDDIPVTSIENDFASEGVPARIFYIGSNVSAIGDRAFFRLPFMESIRLFNGLISIGAESFAGCERMSGVILPPSLGVIGKRAFADCPNLKSVKIPPAVLKIDDSAFEGCSDLTIYCEKGSYAAHFAKAHGIPYVLMPLSREGRLAAKLSFVCRKHQARVDTGEVIPTFSYSPSGDVRMGPMNGPEDPYPVSIRSACALLGAPLPEDATCAKLPSFYLGASRFTGYFGEFLRRMKRYLSHIPIDELKRRYRNFVEEYLMQRNMPLSTTDFMVFFADYILYAWDKGFGHHCYFVYELYNKEPDVRMTFLNAGYRRRVMRACAPQEIRHLFSKAGFNHAYSEYVHRDWIDSSSCSDEEFNSFVAKHRTFFGKVPDGSGGQGARVVSCPEGRESDILDMCRRESLICEELIVQCEELASFNESTLNTIRVTTLLCADGTPRITLATARFGRAGKCADNFHSGGVGAVVDIESGAIISEAIDMYHQRSAVHPDSGKEILGFQIPRWEEIKATVLSSALKYPEARHVGWDVALTSDGNIEYVEGNCLPGFDVMQSPDQVGRRAMYDRYLPEIERQLGIEVEEEQPTVILWPERRSKKQEATENKTGAFASLLGSFGRCLRRKEK